MRKYFLIIIAIVFWINSYSQTTPKLNDFGRIVLNSYLPNDADIPSGAKKLLLNKLDRITSNYGMGGSSVNSRFIITASVNIATKDIIAGPPQMIALNIDVTLFIGDAIEKKKFNSRTVSLKGVGTNENKAYINALKGLKSKNKEVAKFIEEGKSKIIAYYNSKCDFDIRNAITLKNQGKHDEAIYNLSLIPEICQECYFKCIDTLEYIYQDKIDLDCQQKFNKAKTIWAANSTSVGAEQVADVLSEISPLASCQPKIEEFVRAIDKKLKADEKARWEFKMKKYADKVAKEKEQMRIAEEKSIRDDDFREDEAKRNSEFKENQAKRESEYRENQAQRDAEYKEKQSVRNTELDKLKVNAYREVAVEYAKNQPKTVTNNNIYWK